MYILCQDGCLKVDKGKLERVGDDVQGLVDQVQSPALLLPIVTHDKVLFVSVREFQNSWLTA